LYKVENEFSSSDPPTMNYSKVNYLMFSASSGVIMDEDSFSEDNNAEVLDNT